MLERKLSAPEKIMQKLIHMITGETIPSAEAIREKYSGLVDEDVSESGDSLHDAEGLLRRGTNETELMCSTSRNYSSRSVAAQMLDGSWVGWTYWFGGGKYGEPSEIEWIEDAYDVEMIEVTRVVREFRKIETQEKT